MPNTPVQDDNPVKRYKARFTRISGRCVNDRAHLTLPEGSLITHISFLSNNEEGCPPLVDVSFRCKDKESATKLRMEKKLELERECRVSYNLFQPKGKTNVTFITFSAQNAFNLIRKLQQFEGFLPRGTEDRLLAPLCAAIVHQIGGAPLLVEQEAEVPGQTVITITDEEFEEKMGWDQPGNEPVAKTEIPAFAIDHLLREVDIQHIAEMGELIPPKYRHPVKMEATKDQKDRDRLFNTVDR